MNPGERTSVTDPLVVDTLVVPGYGGRIGMTMFPGRCTDVSMFGNHWRRDINADLAVIEALHPCLVLTLNEPAEFELLGVPDFARDLEASGLPWRNLPIPDGGIPDAAFERQWVAVGAQARDCIRGGSLVVIHCRAGLGRTGTIAARLLVELGMEPRAAIDLVRKTRAPHDRNAGARVLRRKLTRSR